MNYYRYGSSSESGSGSGSGSDKKDLRALPIHEKRNSDGTTTKTYPDGRIETVYEPTE
jgi:hypothetical protein